MSAAPLAKKLPKWGVNAKIEGALIQKNMKKKLLP